MSLRGLAQGVLGNLAYDTQMDYDALVQALNDRFAPPDQMELYRIQLKERRQRASETLHELAQHVRRLTNLAYPTVPPDVKETLAKDQFIDALLDSDLRLRIKQARPRSLNDAVRHAVELEAYVKAESKLTESRGVLKSVSTDNNASDMKELQAMIKELTFSMETMKREMGALKKKAYNDMSSVENERNPRIPRRDWKKNAECYNCGERGHIQRECPNKKKKTESPTDSKQGKQSQIKSKVGYNAPKNGAGMFVSASVYGTKVNLLVDTGATLSLLSEDAYNRICCSNPSLGTLDPVKRSVLAANDEPLKTLGRTIVPIAIADNAYETTVFCCRAHCRWSDRLGLYGGEYLCRRYMQQEHAYRQGNGAIHNPRTYWLLQNSVSRYYQDSTEIRSNNKREYLHAKASKIVWRRSC